MRSNWIVPCALLAWLVPALASVDANTASADALRTVRGIGPSIAQRIVDERRKGAYTSLDDLQARVRGVGDASVRKMAAGGLVVGAAGAAGVSGAARPVDAVARPKTEVIEGRGRTTTTEATVRRPRGPHHRRSLEAAR